MSPSPPTSPPPPSPSNAHCFRRPQGAWEPPQARGDCLCDSEGMGIVFVLCSRARVEHSSLRHRTRRPLNAVADGGGASSRHRRYLRRLHERPGLFGPVYGRDVAVEPTEEKMLHSGASEFRAADGHVVGACPRVKNNAALHPRGPAETRRPHCSRLSSVGIARDAEVLERHASSTGCSVEGSTQCAADVESAPPNPAHELEGEAGRPTVMQEEGGPGGGGRRRKGRGGRGERGPNRREEE